MATQYTVKAGDSLNKIAQSMGFKDYKEANISGYGADPNKIQVGQMLSIGGAAPAPTTAPTPGGSRTQDIPGVGTLTVSPKTPPQAAPDANSADLSGLYERLGIAPPPNYKATGPGTIPGLPSYPNRQGAQVSVLETYDKYLSGLDEIEKTLSSSLAPSEEEKQLQRELVAARSALQGFDRGVLERVEGFYGAGRGRTTNNAALMETKERRTSAIERLGLAQEVDTLTAMLGISKEERLAMGDIAQNQYNMASKRLDIALGIQDKIMRIADDERDDARQYLLDVVSFSDGKTYEELDPATQAAILEASANSPITLDMVRTALTSAAEKAKAAKAGELRSVDGIGVVQIDPITGRWKVLIPENPAPTTPTNTTPSISFEKYVENQNIPLPALTPAKLTELETEYNGKYNNAPVSLGKLSADQKSELQQAGLGGAPSAVQSYFLNTPPEFQDSWQRDVASGKKNGAQSLDEIVDAYSAWYTANKSGGVRDWSSVFPEGK